MRKISKIIIHCSDTEDSLDFGVKDINAWHKRRGFLSPSGISCGYHFVIRKNGIVEVGRPMKEVGAHCKGQNLESIGVCWVGRKIASDEQLQTLYSLLRGLLTKYDLETVDIYGHNQFSSKTCPNLDMNFVRLQTLFTPIGMVIDEI